jgi:CBS-domain-containing membrane protein
MARMHDSFVEIYKMFLNKSVHRIPVIDGSGKLKGLVSRSNVLRLLLQKHAGVPIKTKA